MSRVKAFWWLFAAAAVAVSALGLLGCSSKSTADGDASTDNQLSVSASPTSLAVSQTSIVEATVTSGGSGVANQVVFFSVEPSTAGTFTPQYDTTSADGVAASVFTAATAGSAVATISVLGTTLSSSVSLSVSEGQSGSGNGNINVSISQSLLLADGQDTSTVTIVVRDELGQPAPESTLVKITAGEKFVDIDSNGYWSDGIDSLVFDANANGQWDPIGLIPSTAWTVENTGTVTVDYVSGIEAVTVYVKVTVDDNGLVGSTDISVQLLPNAVLNSIYLASDSVSLSVKQTGGIESATLRATGYDINGNTVPEGMTIVFAILDGPGGGERLDTLAYGPDTSVTNSQGVATTTIHSGTISGTVRIRAYSGTVLSNATQVLIAAGPPASIVVAAEDCNVPFWDEVSSQNPVTAIVSDVYNNPVNDSTVVYFTTDEGVVMSHMARTQDGMGIANSIWLSTSDNDVGADGVIWIFAETAGGTVADSGSFINSHIPDTLIITGMPSSLPADGQTKATVYVTGLDLNDNFVDNGTVFETDAIYMSVEDGILGNGCWGASDRIKITSTTLEVDRCQDISGNDDGVGSIDYIQFWHIGGAYTVYACSLLTGNAYSGNSSINGETSVDPGDVVRLSVTIKDRWSNPLADHTLNMTADDGVVGGATQETDAYGEAFGFTWTAPGVDGDYTIIVTDTDPMGGIIMTHGVSVTSSK